MKKLLLLSLLLTLGATAAFSQHTPRDKGKHISVFADFDQLDIDKALLLGQFGLPTFKEMHMDGDNNKVETLYYVEALEISQPVWAGINMVTIVTEFVFKNDRLTAQKSGELNPFDLREIAADVKSIKSKVN